VLDYWFVLPLLTLLGGLFALAPLGVHVLRRGVVFIDLAVAQAAAASTLWLQVFYHTHDAVILISSSIAGALLCAALVSRICIVWPQRREALIGLVYVLGAALALLAAQFNSHGKDDLQQLLAADILWSDETDAWVAIASGLSMLLLSKWRQALLERDAYFFAIFAVITSLLVQSIGVYLVFVLLIAPALLIERMGMGKAMVLVISAIALGLAASWYQDLPSGVSLSLTLTALVLLSSLIQTGIEAVR
jgi:zinc/manganese transport system permease protein